jgi:hypothetical protein
MRQIKDYDESWLERQTPFGLFLKAVGFLVAAGLMVSLIGLPLGWYSAGRQVVSATNVRAQWQFAYDADAAMREIANNWCTYREAELSAPAEDRSQRTSQRIALESLYRLRAGEYNGRLADKFRAGLVAPGDVPNPAPDLRVRLVQVGCEQLWPGGPK